MARVSRWMVLVLASALGTGCMSLSVFQGPEAIGQGELAAGIGTLLFPADSTSETPIGFWPEASLRYGLGNGFDIGAKFAGVPPFGAIYGDVRWQFLDTPVPVTAGFGASYAGLPSDTSDEALSFTVLYPSLAVGTDRFWVAGRGILTSLNLGEDLLGTSQDFIATGQAMALSAGTSFGEGLRLLPELTVLLGSGETAWMVGIGVQYRTGSDDGG